MRPQQRFTLLQVLFEACLLCAPAYADGVYRPTYPGTSVPNRMAPGYVEQNENGKTVLRETYPGTSVPNLLKPGFVEEGNGIYPTYPGTNIRNYSQPGYISDEQ